MKSVISSFFALSATASGASELPIEDLRARIEKTYDAQISARITDTKRSLMGCRIEEVQLTGQDPVTTLDREVNLIVYHPTGKSNGKAVIILPPTGGVNILDRGYANELCAKGMTAVIVSSWEGQDEVSLDFDMHNKGALRALSATKHTIEYIDQLGFDSIGLMGTSVGAMSATLVLGFEDRISSMAFIVGAANFTEVLVTSDEKGAKKIREARLKRFSYKNLKEYEKAVRENVWVDPISFLPKQKTVRSLVISADNDTTVSTESQYELAKLIQADQHIRRKGNHFQVIKSSFVHNRDEISKFFQ